MDMRCASDDVELWLPPKEVRLIDPDTEKLPTPVDGRGLVRIETLIEDLKRTVDPTYRWPDVFSDDHHYYWHADWYSEDELGNGVIPRDFRELPVHKGKMPRHFHNWIHRATEPPPVPSADVMAYRIEAWRVADTLFQTARKSLALERLTVEKWARKFPRRAHRVDTSIPTRQVMSAADLAEVWGRHTAAIDSYRQALATVPPEFHVITEEDLSDPRRIARRLGHFSISRSALHRRVILSSAA